ncbi:glycosyltransferase family 39 protein [Patescibacteria group bacterium]
MNKLIKQVLKYKYIEYILLAIIIIFGFIVRLYKVNNPVADWHSWRQADTASVSKTYLDEGINLLYPRYQDISSIQTGYLNPKGYRFVEFPIFNAVHVISFKLQNLFSFEVIGRTVSILCALVTSYFVFKIGKKYLGKWGGLLASFYFLFIPYNIYFTRVILPEPMGTTFGLIGVWLFLKYLDNDKKLDLYFSGIFFAFAALIKPFILFYSIPLIYLLLQKYSFKEIKSNSKVLIPLLVFANIILDPLLLWRVWMNRHFEGIPFFAWAFNGDKIRFRPAYWYWIYGERISKLILGFWGLVPLVFGIITSTKKKIFNLIFFSSMLFYALVVATASVRHDYYQIFLIPSIALLLAQGTIFLWENKIFNKVISRTLLVFSIFIMFLVSLFQVKEFYKINHPELMEAGDAVKRLTPEDALVIAPYNGDTAFIYQTGRWGWPAIDSSIDKIIGRGGDYYVSVNFNDKDTIEAIDRFETIEQTPTYVIVDLHKPIKK